MTWRSSTARSGTMRSWTSAWWRISRSSGDGTHSRGSWRGARKTSFEMWSAGSGRSFPSGAGTPDCTGRTGRPRPRPSWRATARRSSRRAPPTCWGCGVRGPKRTVLRGPDGAGRRLAAGGREWPAVDLPDGSALVVARDVPALGYLALAERAGGPNPPKDDGTALEAQAGRFHVVLDPATGAIRSLTGGEGRERVKPGAWSGLNELVYVTGGARSALWTDGAREHLAVAPALSVATARLDSARRERLPGIGARLIVARKLEGFPTITSSVTLYDELPWIDIENRVSKTATLDKEALYVAFPFSFTKPTVEVEVPLGRMTVEQRSEEHTSELQSRPHL